MWQTAAHTLQDLLLNGPSSRGPKSNINNININNNVINKSNLRTDPAEKLLTFLDPDYKYPFFYYYHFNIIITTF